jgi:RNA polymerase sigma-70 factor (ECF subfamily)
MSKDFSGYTDAELWQAFVSGEEDAFGYVYHQYAPLLYHYGRHILKNRQLVEDCIHDLFVYLDQHRTTLGATSSIKYYLFRALRRRITETVALQDRFSGTPGPSEGYDFGIVSSPEAQLIACQSAQFRHEELIKALNQLPRRQREVLYLLYFNELSYQEIASIMSLEVRTVYNQVHNALQTMKKHLGQNALILLRALLVISILTQTVTTDFIFRQSHCTRAVTRSQSPGVPPGESIPGSGLESMMRAG